MIFPYSTIISRLPGSSKEYVLRRPEIPITINGPSGTASLIALVDTGADYTILPRSVADTIGVGFDEAMTLTAEAFGGQRLNLLVGDASLRIESNGESIAWTTTLFFYEFADNDDEVAILGHAGFLDYFTATFDGAAGVLALTANDQLPPT